MNTRAREIQQLKMAWLAAKEAGNTQAQLALLRDHPAEQAELVDFIAAYRATDAPGPDALHTPTSPMTQRATQAALERVFGGSLLPPTLPELRIHHAPTIAPPPR